MANASLQMEKGFDQFVMIKSISFALGRIPRKITIGTLMTTLYMRLFLDSKNFPKSVKQMVCWCNEIIMPKYDFRLK
jgi:hypothetical protein